MAFIKRLTTQQLAGRVGFIDEVRGFAIICMVFYHAAYDLVEIFGFQIPFFYSDTLNILRTVFAGIFIFISGVACRYSKNNCKRGLICLGFGMLMTIGTWLFVREQIIIFGILHMLGASMLIFGLFRKILDKIPAFTGIIITSLLFVFTFQVENGAVGIPGVISLALPRGIYTFGWFAPFGFISQDFYSADYFALLPWLFLFLCGSYIGVYFKQEKMPAFFYRTHISQLAFVGRHTIIIYLIHQPIIYGIMLLIFSLMK